MKVVSLFNFMSDSGYQETSIEGQHKATKLNIGPKPLTNDQYKIPAWNLVCLYCSDANADEVRWDRQLLGECYGGWLIHLFVAPDC